MVHNVNSVSDPSLPSSGVPKEESKGTLGPHQVQVSDPGKAIVPWHGTPESTSASGCVESSPQPPRLPNKPTSAPLLPAAKQKPQRKMRATVQDLKSIPHYLRDKILKLAASDVRTNVAWRGRLSTTLDAEGRPKAQGIATLHQSTRSVFHANVNTLPDLKALSKWTGMTIEYLGITFDLNSDHLQFLPPKIHTLELKPGFGADAPPRSSVPTGIGKKEISALKLNNMMVFSHDITEIAKIENLHHLTIERGWTFIDGLATALTAATHIQDLRLVNASLRGSEPELRHGPSTSKDCRNLMRSVAQIPHLHSLMLVGIEGIIPPPSTQANATQTAHPITSRPQPRRLTLTEVEPLLTGCQRRLDLSNNEIAFDLDTIPALGANLKWLSLKGNPISPETIQRMRGLYPGTHIEADDAVQSSTAPESQ